MPAPARVVLVGGGHSHLEILRRQILRPHPRISLTLISAGPRQHYSGMVPGFLAGIYSEEEIAFDLNALAERAGGRFFAEKAVAIDPAGRSLRLSNGRLVEYDFVSFGIGSGTKGSDLPGVREHAWTVKPIQRAVALRGALLALARGTGTAHAAIVGAGAAGVEIACAAAAVLDGAGRARQITILDGGPEIMEGYEPRFRRLARRALEAKGCAISVGASVSEVRENLLRLADGREIPSDLTVWLTGPAPVDLFRGSGLALDPRGYLLVDESLRSVSDARIFGVGDCATLAAFPATPKAGVYAVREGPILWESLIAAVDSTPPPRYQPQSGFLSILNTADGKALLRYGGFNSQSRWAWRLKDRIDRRFMRKYQSLVHVMH
ncbi:MAG: FAD-dependent oxidoreductase [Acidobacteriota bacterium]